MPGGHRWMYYATGLPGWMRFGWSPGWGGIPPGAQFLIQSGLWPQFWSWIQSQMPYAAMSPPPRPIPMMPYSSNPTSRMSSMGMPGMPSEQEIRMLEDQARLMEEELNRIRRRIEELERER